MDDLSTELDHLRHQVADHDLVVAIDPSACPLGDCSKSGTVQHDTLQPDSSAGQQNGQRDDHELDIELPDLDDLETFSELVQHQDPWLLNDSDPDLLAEILEPV